jgi:hypothetical protein
VIITLDTTFVLLPVKSSLYSVFNYVISPYQTYLVYLIFNPIDLLKFYIKIYVFLTYDENTSEATIGVKGTLGPNYCAIASDMAVFPVPCGPAKSTALPAIFFSRIKSTIIPPASLANY